MPADLIPLVIEASEWDLVSRGVRQRVRALEAFLADAYGRRRAFDDGVVPWRLLYTSGGFRREVAGFAPPNGVRVHVAGIDLIRDEQGGFRVLEDDVRAPAGVGRVIADRLAKTSTFPAPVAGHGTGQEAEYPARLLAALRAAAPRAVADPFVVVLTPGGRDAGYSEHALLARLMGIELLQGRDLSCYRNRVYAHTTRGRRPVDVIYRHVPDDWLDPVHLRPESRLGCPGLINAARAGNVTIANAVGNDVAGGNLSYTYLPDLIRYYLGEEPLLQNVESFRLEDPDVPRWVLGELGNLVLKPADGASGAVIGPRATREELAEVRAKIEADPGGWMAQRPVALAASPVLAESPVLAASPVLAESPALAVGRLAPPHIGLRVCAVNDGDDVWVLPGGLARVALGEEELAVRSSPGGGSKDTRAACERDG